MTGNKVILIVDDEYIILESLKIQINNVLDSNIILEAASSAEEAFTLIDEFYDNQLDLVLVISDYHLDETKGTDIMHYVSKKYPLAHKSILSGRSEMEMIPELADQLGVVNFIAKPWDFEEIKNTIKTALNKK